MVVILEDMNWFMHITYVLVDKIEILS